MTKYSREEYLQFRQDITREENISSAYFDITNIVFCIFLASACIYLWKDFWFPLCLALFSLFTTFVSFFLSEQAHSINRESLDYAQYSDEYNADKKWKTVSSLNLALLRCKISSIVLVLCSFVIFCYKF